LAFVSIGYNAGHGPIFTETTAGEHRDCRGWLRRLRQCSFDLIALNNRELNNNLQIGVCIAGVLVAAVGIGNLFRRPVVALLVGLAASPLLAAIIVALRFKSFE
jgi:hypothetical protein